MVPIKLAENFRTLFYAPFYAVQALGFYAREGVEVVPINSAAPAAALPGLLDGTIDLSWGGPMRVMKARDRDPDSQLVCFCEVVARDPFFLLGRGDRAGFVLADLKRLRLATVAEVPTPWLCLAHDLRENGIDPDLIDRVTGATMGDNLAALGRGEIDVIQVFEPYVSMALKAGIGDILHAASARGPTVYTTFLATRASIKTNHAAFAAIVRAVGHMQSWLADRGADALAATVTPFYPDVAPDILSNALRRYHEAGVWARSAEVSRQGFARLAAALRSGGFVTRLHRYEECVDADLQ